MRHLLWALAAVSLGLTAACSSGGGSEAAPDSGSILETPDASTPDAGEGDLPDASTSDAACDLVHQTDCPSGYKCTVTNASGTIDCGRAGAGGDYEPCANDSECAPGFFCSSNPGKPGACHAFCATSSDCPDRQQCVVTLPQQPKPLLCTRVEGCDPFRHDCPDATEACYPTPGSGACYAPGAANLGERCVYNNDCVKGAVCIIPTDGDPSCMQVCDPAGAAGAACPEGKKCYGLSGFAVGVCD